MSNTPVQEPPAGELSSGSGQTLPPRPLRPISDPSAPKRVCFYKSGDYTFSGHRMVINARTFKTFDALLDALAKKVPLAFGVRTITTPRGTNLVKALDDLHDGGSYVCSDHKRVKPLNLVEVNRRQVPWNAAGLLSAGRRRRQGAQFGPFGRRNEVITSRSAKITERAAVQTPKRLVVIRNRDPTVKRTIVLQRRTAPTFDALLDYLSQILQFPVLKLFSTDGRRIDGLAGLILCTGVVVAAGNEPFRLGNYSFHGASQMAQVMYVDTVESPMLQPRTENNKSLSSGRGSRNFSLSSERYIVNQINKSRNGSTSSHLHHHSRSFESEVDHRHASGDTCGTGRVDNELNASIVPQDDDIEKSFRVNQDGSMTVEMKVRLTIKEEEMLHWTTTLSRSSLSKGAVCASISESGNSSPDSNNAIAKNTSSSSEDGTREENHPAGPGKGVDFQDQQANEGYTSMALGKSKTGFKRTPTPGPRHVTKKASVESVKTVTDSRVQESTLGHYSYMERTSDGEKTEGYCIVRHSSSSSNRPIPKSRKTKSAGESNKGSNSSARSSGVAEVLQIENNGMEEDRLRPHKSAEAIGPADSGLSSSTANLLDPKANTKHVLHELYSSIHCIRSACEANTTSNLEKSNSLPHFPTQVASVFGSSCKAFVSFLSVVTLRDNLTGSALEDDNESEAMLMMESLQKISAIEDEQELRESLTDLQSRASSQFRERWKDFQNLRERLESEPLSPKFSDTEFALDVLSEGSDAFENIEELMDELNMPQDLRAEISSTIHQAKSFYPVEESTFVETERNQSDSEDDVEQFVEECNNETKQSPELNITSIAEDITRTKLGNDNGEIDKSEKMQSVYSESDQEPYKEPEISQTDRDESLTDKEHDKEEEEQVNEVREVENEREDGHTKEIDGEETEKREREEEAEEGTVTEVDDKESQEEWEAEKGRVEDEDSVQEVEEGTEEEMTMDEEEDREKLEEAEEVLMDEEVQEAREDASVEETDDRDGDEETEEGEDEADEGEKSEEEKRQGDENEEEAGEVIEESDEGEEEENIIEEVKEGEEDEADDFIGETDEGEEVGNIKEVDEEEEADEAMGETDGEGIGNIIEEVEEEEEEEEEGEGEADAVTEDVEEEAENGIEEENNEEEKMKEGIEEKDEEEDVENIIEEIQEEEEEEDTDAVTETHVEREVIEEKDEEEENTEVASEENDEEEEEIEQEVVEDGEDVEVINTEDRVVRRKSEESRKESEETGDSLEEESVGGKEVLEKIEENVKARQMLDDKERENDEENENNELNEGLDETEEQESKDEEEEENASEDADGTVCKNLLEEASYLQQQSSCDEANADAKVAEHNTESPTKYSSDCQCEDDKGNGTDTGNEFATDDGGEPHEEGSGTPQHPVEISQELLDFVNSALQSSSLIFTYDARGNVRIEPDSARVTQNKQSVIPKRRKDNSYGLKRLPSPSTSGLSDYRPETSESGGYKTQESVDIVSESGEEADIPIRRTNVVRADSKQSVASNAEALQNSRLKSGGSFSSHDSGTKASKEDLSYFSAASSQKAETDPATEATRCISCTPEKDSPDGVLIDQGRWLLKENHLIRKSPPVSLGMYDQFDSTSVDTDQENTSVDSPSHCNAQHNPLAAISSSELEEMAKPQTPKCTYYNMPHGSDSDPFLDDSSVKTGKRDASSVRGRGFRVSPTIDTSKTWANKNGSLSSFASVEFKVSDRKVHPEGESSAVTRARWTPSGRGDVLQAQDSRDTLYVRCGQYCPIL
ncbi:hypothetical protein VZT92_003820 [Zoarces viviparus]|uniref:Doublecortin domain-containing protein n=1 Tax=Zoarces viviparus TaxID=48416 RepID=A0AAW1FWX8_ZOAVI